MIGVNDEPESVVEADVCQMKFCLIAGIQNWMNAPGNTLYGVWIGAERIARRFP
jgi:hypothetical protein